MHLFIGIDSRFDIHRSFTKIVKCDSPISEI